MKSLLICPDLRPGVRALATSEPLSNVPLLGKCLLEYWVEHLAVLGAREILILAADRPEQVSARLGDGARWGLRIIVKPDKCERTPEEARAQHQATDAATWLPAPNDAILMDHLPGRPQLPLCTSYAGWFAATQALMSCARTPDRIGVQELKPGVWAGLNAHVSADAQLVAPCWIGEGARIEADAVVGPHAVLEREVFVGRGAEVSHSVIGPETLVGQFTEIRHSIALGSTLVNWKRGSCVKVPDEFLLCAREPQRARAAPVSSPATAPVHAPRSATARVFKYVSSLLT